MPAVLSGVFVLGDHLGDDTVVGSEDLFLLKDHFVTILVVAFPGYSNFNLT